MLCDCWFAGNSRRTTSSLMRAIWLFAVGAIPVFGADEFIRGADVSHLAFFEDRGIVYRSGGQASNALVILKQSGLNCARLRLFTSSAQQAQADPYNSIK
jgi:arabinogalactan endo-1,4-beta-galactosidase